MHTIMIVDDEVSVLAGLARLFGRVRGISLLTCDTPHEGLQLAATQNIDLFIADYRMPGMNGVEFLVFARQIQPGAVRFLLSGTSDFTGLANAVNRASIHRFIPKPIDSRELLFMVRQGLVEGVAAANLNPGPAPVVGNALGSGR